MARALSSLSCNYTADKVVLIRSGQISDPRNSQVAGIAGVNVFQKMTTDNVFYNLAGQKFNKPQKGINIINGKKILVK